MTYKELVKAISGDLDLSQEAVKRSLSDVIEVLVDLADDKPVNISGFGTLKTSIRKSRISFNPKEKCYQMLPPKRILKFAPGSKLKEEVQSWETNSER